jgi:hypothetical protein
MGPSAHCVLPGSWQEWQRDGKRENALNSALVGTITFACTFAGAMFGMWLRSALPEHHLDNDSRDSIKTGVGLIAAMSALVLGLVTASAKSSYDSVDTGVRSAAADILTLDRQLARYGPETSGIRATLKQLVAQRVEAIWPAEPGRQVQLDPQRNLRVGESLIEQMRALAPHGPTQDTIKSSALQLAESLLKVRWMAVTEGSRTIPLPFLVILLLWLTLTFTSFGLFSPKNPTVIAVLLVCALSIGSALFLVLEMDTPLDGWLKVSADPMRFTLSHLDQ